MTPVNHELGTGVNPITMESIPTDSQSIAEEEQVYLQEEITRIITSGTTSHNNQDLSQNVLTRLSTLSQKLSKRLSLQTGDEFQYDMMVDPKDFDLHKILQSFLRSASAQGIHLRSTGVVFQDVTTNGVDSQFSVAPTVGDFVLGPLEAVKSIVNKKQNKKQNKKVAEKKIVQGITGMVKPGEMCLVLGRPGAGCSTFLKTLAGDQLDQFVSTSGEIQYDGIPQEEMIQRYKSDIIYNGELDLHHPHLTVDQTLRFAIGCKTPHTRVGEVQRERYIVAMRDLLATIFGLRHTYDTKVGNDYIRGVSGGERKRVSIAEALAARGTVYCWDNATRGLDASTALEYAQAIRTMTSLNRSVAFVTVYQAGEMIYETFDKVLVLYEGRQVFFGPAESAKQYFIDLGFECPARQATAEFLTAVTDPKGRVAREGMEQIVPRTAREFEQAWQRSSHYAQLMQHIQEYSSLQSATETKHLYDTSLAQEKKSPHSRYTIPFTTQLKLLTLRGFQRVKGDAAYNIIDCVASVVQALIIGSLYYNTPQTTAGAFSRGGVVFFCVLYYSLMGLAQMTAQFAERPILMKQSRSYSLYYPSAEVLAAVATRFPFKFVSLFLFFVIMYFLSNLSHDAGKFFMNLLFLTVTSETITALFQAVAALSGDIAQANAVAGFLIMVLLIYTGFNIQLKSMHPWFKWLSYLNPVRWGYESMLATEFHGKQMDCGNTLVPSGEGYAGVSSSNQVCAFVGSQLGQSWVNGDRYMAIQFNYSYHHVWRNFGILVAFFVFFVVVNAVAMEFKKASKNGGDRLFFKRGVSSSSSSSSSSSTVEEVVVLDKINVNSHEDIEARGCADDDEDELAVLSSAAKSSASSASSESLAEDTFVNLGSTGIFIWQNINYVIPYKGESRKLLDNVHGYVKPGTLTALMGESGAGKTTLLNVLSQRIDFGTITGDFLVNGQPLDATFKRSTGYVQQQDLHISEMTVRESLQFAARLRRPKTVSDAEKMGYVEKIIDVLDMNLYADAIVGSLGSGLNVEQRKKLSIGVELVAKPSLLLFLDEPTSGLDSQSAWSIVQLLRRLATAGQSILCTIHQPSATLFESFDRLLLLKKGGQTVYFGDIGANSSTVLEYFESNGARKCETFENPAEYILEAIGAGATANAHEDWFDIWTRSKQYQDTTKEVSYLKTKSYQEEEEEQQLTEEDLHSTYAMPYSSQLYYVTMRTGLQIYRSPQYVMAKFMLFLSAGLFVGFTFWNIDQSMTGLQNAMFACFLPITLAGPLMNQIQQRAIESRELFEVRESKSNTFHWSTLLLSQFVNEVPYTVSFATVYFFCLYYPLKVFPEASRAGLFFLFYSVMFSTYVISLALMIIYFSPDLPSAAVIGGLFLSFLISFCGVVQPMSLMPKFWTFMYRVSPLTYYVENMMALLIHGKPVHCAADELAYFNPPSGQTCAEFATPYVEAVSGYLTNPDVTEACGYCRYSIGDQYLATVGVKYSDLWRNFGLFWVYLIFNLVAMCVVYYAFRVAKWDISGFFKKKMERKKQQVNKENKDDSN